MDCLLEQPIFFYELAAGLSSRVSMQGFKAEFQMVHPGTSAGRRYCASALTRDHPEGLDGGNRSRDDRQERGAVGYGLLLRSGWEKVGMRVGRFAR